MFGKHKLRTLFLCLALLAGNFGGVPMRPEEIEELMHRNQQPEIVYVIPDERERGDDTVEPPAAEDAT